MKKYYTPIYIIGGFNLFTLILYIASPYNLYGNYVFESYIYIFINILLIVSGYLTGAKIGFKKRSVSNISSRDVKKLINFIIYFYAATFLIKYAYLLKFHIFDISGMFEFLLIGLYDPQAGYKLTADTTRSHTVSWSIFFLISIFNSIYFIVVFLAWGSLSRTKKAISLFFIIIEIFFWAGRGTNFGIISLLVTFLFARLIYEDKVGINNILKAIAIFLISIIIFSIIMAFRSEPAEDLQVYALQNSSVDEASIFFSLTPESIHPTILLIFSYLVQGYYYMSYAFELDFRPTWFGGSTPAVVGLYDALGINTFNSSYVYRLSEYGIDPYINWHSAYTWYANDLSFVLAPIISFIFGWILGLTWVKAILSNDFFSKILFLIFAPASIFIFSNNNYFSNYFYSILFFMPIFIYRNFFRKNHHSINKFAKVSERIVTLERSGTRYDGRTN